MIKTYQATEWFQSIQRMLLIGLIGAFGLFGCASLNTYNVEESTLQAYLSDQIKGLEPQNLNDKLPISLSVTDVNLQLGPDGREVAVLDVGGEALIDTYITKVPVSISLTVEGKPVYESKEKAVYIRGLKLVDSELGGFGFKAQLQPAAEAILGALSKILDHTPVYRLDESDIRQRFLGLIPLDMTIGQGKLVFKPAK